MDHNKLLAAPSHSAKNEITFIVDDVEPDFSPLTVLPAPKLLNLTLSSTPLALSHDESCQLVADMFDKIHGSLLHPLLYAVHLAFSQHRPLIITPDDIWMTISQGFAQHINNHAEKLRSKFVRHKGKMTLKVTAARLVDLNDWRAAIEKWIEMIYSQVDPTLHRLLLCDFSTTTEVIKTASHIVMLDAFQRYFDLQFACICGIPNITLRGTPADWQTIRAHAEELAEYDLEWWTSRLLSILDQFVEAAQGRPLRRFWQEIYKPEEIYGGEVVTGWIAELFPYLNNQVNQSPDVKNPMLEIPRDQIKVKDGIRPRSFPMGLSQAPFTLIIEEEKYRLKLVGGFIGVTQQADTGQLATEIGWCVQVGDPFEMLLDQLVEQHKTNPPIDWLVIDRPLEMPKELIQLADRSNGIEFYPDTTHPWHFLSPEKYYYCNLLEYDSQPIHFADLGDGRGLAYDFISRAIKDESGKIVDWHHELWVVLGRIEEVAPRFNQLYDEITGVELAGPVRGEKGLINPTVIAKSVTELFERMANYNGGYYFDAPSFQPDDCYEALK
ncbi:MAG: DUF4419 domain-containing protein [Acidobacteriota bacterium]